MRLAWMSPVNWGTRAILATSMLVIASVAYAGFFTFVAVGRVEISTSEGANVVPLGTTYLCTVETPPGIVESCTASKDGRAVHGVFSGISPASLLRLRTDYRNNEPETVCISFSPSNDPKVTYGPAGQTGLGEVEANKQSFLAGIRVFFDTTLEPGDAFDLDYTLTFETLSSAGGSCQ